MENDTEKANVDLHIKISKTELKKLSYITAMTGRSRTIFFKECIEREYDKLEKSVGSAFSTKQEKTVTIQLRVKDLAFALEQEGFKVACDLKSVNRDYYISVSRGDHSVWRPIEPWIMKTANPFYYVHREITEAVNEIKMKEMIERGEHA